MKTTTLILVLALTAAGLMLASCSSGNHREHEQSQTSGLRPEGDYYTCPMHPSVISDRPGACPVCGMALVKRSPQRELTPDDAAMLATVSLSPTQRVMANVHTVRVERRAMAREINTVGVVDFAEPLHAFVAARFRGRVEKLHVNFTGDVVRRGDPLFELYSPELVTTQREYLLALENRQSLELYEDGSGAGLQARLVETAAERLRIHYGMTKLQIAELERTRQVRSTVTFHAPISGTVIRKQLVEGQYVEEGTLAYQVVDLSRVWVIVEVYEKDLRFVRLNQPMTITTDAYPGERFHGRVSFIEPILNPETRTVRVRAEFSNASAKLKPHIYVRATLEASLGRVLAVPADAVIRTGLRDVVWVEVRDNQFEPRDVRLGSRADGFYEILDGLREGEVVASSGGYLIDSESLLAQPGTTGAHTHDAATTRPAAEREDARRVRTELTITVEYGYSPEVVHVKRGLPVRLLFHRLESSTCTEEVVLKDFGIRKKLPAFATTAIEITPFEKGEFQFSCGMDMLHGKLIVE